MKADGEFRALQTVLVRDEETMGFVMSTNGSNGQPYRVMYWQGERHIEGWFAATELSTV